MYVSISLSSTSQKLIHTQGRRLLILATTSRLSALQMLDMEEIFNDKINVPAVTKYEELASLIQQARAFEDDSDINASLNELRSITGSDNVGLGVKKVLNAISSAKQDTRNAPSLFAEIMSRKMAAGP